MKRIWKRFLSTVCVAALLMTAPGSAILADEIHEETVVSESGEIVVDSTALVETEESMQFEDAEDDAENYITEESEVEDISFETEDIEELDSRYTIEEDHYDEMDVGAGAISGTLTLGMNKVMITGSGRYNLDFNLSGCYRFCSVSDYIVISEIRNSDGRLIGGDSDFSGEGDNFDYCANLIAGEDYTMQISFDTPYYDMENLEVTVWIEKYEPPAVLSGKNTVRTSDYGTFYCFEPTESGIYIFIADLLHVKIYDGDLLLFEGDTIGSLEEMKTESLEFSECSEYLCKGKKYILEVREFDPTASGRKHSLKIERVVNHRILVNHDDDNATVKVTSQTASGYDKVPVKEGELVTLTVYIESGHYISDITVTDEGGNEIPLSGRSFVMPKSDARVSVDTIEVPPSVHIGDNQLFSIAPESIYSFTPVESGEYRFDTRLINLELYNGNELLYTGQNDTDNNQTALSCFLDSGKEYKLRITENDSAVMKGMDYNDSYSELCSLCDIRVTFTGNPENKWVVGDKVTAKIVTEKNKKTLYFDSKGGTLWTDWQRIPGESLRNVKKIAFTDGSTKMYLPKNSTRLFSYYLDAQNQEQFYLSNLEEIDLTKCNTSKTVNMQYMFCNLNSLQKLDLSTFKTNAVEKMTSMFQGCGNLKLLNVSGFNTSKVKSMRNMFSGCSAIMTLNLSGFDTTNLTDIRTMFSNCTHLRELDLSSFIILKEKQTVTGNGAISLFNGCTALNILKSPSQNDCSISLPLKLQDDSGKSYTKLPVLAKSITLKRAVNTSDVIVYDAADFSYLKDRTKESIMNKYMEAQKAGFSYNVKEPKTYYDVPASTEVPYAIGVVSSDTLNAMKETTNFYRWLIGVEPLKTNTKSNASLQAQAFDRNFHFSHDIFYEDKPDDMPSELWNIGVPKSHNILALGSPTGSIRTWLNEGFDCYSLSWDTVGHRRALLDARNTAMVFGYSGHVAIGRLAIPDRPSYLSNVFASFPAAGYMPSHLLTPEFSSWTVEFNYHIIDVSDKVVITIENLTSGEKFIRTQDKDTAKIASGFLEFLQPPDAVTEGSDLIYKDPYKVTVTGLIDVATGKKASITYTVDFFTMPEIWRIDIPQEVYAHTGKQIRPEGEKVYAYGDDEHALERGKDYTIKYYNNIEEGTALIEVKGKGEYCGIIKKSFEIKKLIDIGEASVAGVSLSYGYSGKAYTPNITVKVNGVTLKRDTDYTVKYANNVKPGTATITITGEGNYTGTRKKTFEIVDCVSSIVSGKTYQLIPKNNSKTAVCSFSGRMVNNTKVYITDRSSSEAMKFKAVKNADGTWKFINAKCELALAVQQNSSEVGKGIVLYDQTTRKAQNWKLSKKSDNSFAILNAVTGYSIAMSDLSAVKGTTLSMAETASSGLQRFYLAETSPVDAVFDGTKSVRAAKDSTFGINIASASKTDGANVNLCKYSNTNAKKFKIIYSGGGYYRLVNVNSGLVVSVKGNTKTNGANVVQRKWAGESGQRWKFTKNSDGSVTLTNALGTVLHLNGNKMANETNVIAKSAATTTAQRWYLQ